MEYLSDDYMYGISSFDKNHLLKHLPKDVPIRSAEVPTLTVATLLTRHSITKIDLLQIDVEGYDYEVIKMLDFNVVKPTVINFEHMHIPRPQRWECYRHLAAHGYDLAASRMNTVAFLQQSFDC